MSTCFLRSAVMFWAEMMMSHLPPVSAGMIVSKTEFTISTSRPEALADLLADLDVGPDRVALVVEELLRRVRDVGADQELAREDELVGWHVRDCARRGGRAARCACGCRRAAAARGRAGPAAEALGLGAGAGPAAAGARVRGAARANDEDGGRRQAHRANGRIASTVTSTGECAGATVAGGVDDARMSRDRVPPDVARYDGAWACVWCAQEIRFRDEWPRRRSYVRSGVCAISNVARASSSSPIGHQPQARRPGRAARSGSRRR